MVRLFNDFTRVCNITENGEELCACDFRLNLYNCTNSELFVLGDKILIVMCLVATIMGVGLFIYLIKCKKQPFFLPASPERGWLRPRPMHSYHLVVITYMFFEALHLIALVNELYPSILMAEIGSVIMVFTSSSSAIFYTVSIVYSTPSVQFDANLELLNKKKGPNKRLVDALGIILFLQPPVTWVPLAAVTGYYAENNDVEKANFFFTLKFLAIVIWQLFYLVVLAYFWYKLMAVIKGHIKVLEERNVSSGLSDKQLTKQIKKGTKNITVPVFAIVGGLFLQAVIYIFMSLTYRTGSIHSPLWNLYYYWIEYVFFPLIALTVESCLIYFYLVAKKKSNSTITNIKRSTQSTSKPTLSSQTHVNSETVSNENENEPETILSCRSLKDVKEKFGMNSRDNNNPPSTVIQCTSETITLVEDINERNAREISLEKGISFEINRNIFRG